MNNQLYNVPLLAEQMQALEMTPPQLAKKAGVSIFSVHAALAGNLGTMKVLRKVSDALGVKWEYITTVNLPQSEFHRALKVKRIRVR